MTLDKLTTPFEHRRVIEYGRDGNTVVRHWYEVQHVVGSIYKSKDVLNDRGEPEFKLFVFFGDTSDGMQFEWLSHPERYTVEQVAETMRRCKVDSATHMYVDLNDRMEQNIIRLPVSWFLAFALCMGFPGIFYGQALSPVLPAIVGLLYFKSRKWEQKKLIQKSCKEESL